MPPIVLNPGDFHFGAAPLRIATLLGSCVTVTLWHPRRRIGGMCHFQVPERPPRQTAELDGHYATDAFALFDEAIAQAKTRHHEYQAKMFGGGNMFPDARIGIDLGKRNIAMAHRLLKQRNIPLLVEHTGGAGHRKLVFDLGSGEVRMVFADQQKIITTA